MGTKFSHFSILNSTIEEATELLQLMPKKTNFYEMMKRLSPESAEEFKKLEDCGDKNIEMAMRRMNSQKREYFIGKNHDWTTVFSEEFGFESIDNYSLILSKKSNKTFLTVGLFDEDVFTLSVIKIGEILTHHVSGDAEAYEMKQSLGNSAIFAETFNIVPRKDELEQILESNDEDLYKKIMELEKLFNMKLWINRSAPKEMGWKKVVV
jgi:succinate dehydrogenase flavin-adding protein (antitoxin of CptAB toxin-antitoxin module)